MDKSRRTKIIFLIINIFIAMLGCVRIFYATEWGPWAFSDSASYFSAARNLFQGEGMIIKKAGGGMDYYESFPPLYPILLGAIGSLVGNFVVAARYINVLAFGIFLFLSGLVLFNLTRQPVISLVAPAILIVSPMMITDFSGAMTEPIFLPTMMFSFLMLATLIRTPNLLNTIAFILISSILPVIRYVGGVFIFMNFFILILFIPKTLKKRAVFSFTVTLFSLVPLLMWLISLHRLTSLIGGRKIDIASSFAFNFFEGCKEISDILQSFLPYKGHYENIIASNVRLPVVLAIYLILITVSIYLLMKGSTARNSEGIKLEYYLPFPVYIIAFIVFIAFSFSITNRSYRIDERQLSTLIPLIIFTSLLSLCVLLSHMKFMPLAADFIILCLFAFIFRYYFFPSRNLVQKFHENGYGYTARQYQESGIIEAIKQIPPEKIIISNSSGFILFYDNRLPLQVDQFHHRMFGSGNSYGEGKFRDQQAALVLLIPDFNNYYGVQAKMLLPSIINGLNVAYWDAVGGIYYYPDM